MPTTPDLRLPGVLEGRVQLGYVVPDIDEAARHWAVDLGFGPWVVLDRVFETSIVRHRGEVSEVRIAIGFAQAGETQLELVQPLNDAPSPYRDFLDGGGRGLHHLGFWAEDYWHAHREFERLGFTEVCTIETPDGDRVATYFDTPPWLGIMVELIPAAARQGFMGAIERLGDDWDGARPVRRYADRHAFIASPDHRP